MATKKKYKLEGDITFKQTWKIASNFAKQSASAFPDFSENQLVRLFQGTIFHYHEEQGNKLSKKEASDLIADDPPVPKHYYDHLSEYLQTNKKRVKSNRKKSNDQSLLLDIMNQDIAKQEK